MSAACRGRRIARRLNQDHLVAADAGSPIRERARRFRVDRDRRAAAVEHDEVVAKAVHLEEPNPAHRRRLYRRARIAVQRQAGGRRADTAKYNENHSFSPETAGRQGTIARYFSCLHGKFVNWRINRIFPPNNELKAAYQAKNSRIRAVREKALAMPCASWPRVEPSCSTTRGNAR